MVKSKVSSQAHTKNKVFNLKLNSKNIQTMLKIYMDAKYWINEILKTFKPSKVSSQAHVCSMTCLQIIGPFQFMLKLNKWWNYCMLALQHIVRTHNSS